MKPEKLILALFSLIYASVFCQIPTANLKCWLKSNEGLVLNGIQLNAWLDQSGSSFNFTTTSSPQITQNAVANFQGINFNSNYFISDSSISFSDFTIFLVYKKNGAITPYERLIDQNISSGFWLGRDALNVNTFGGGYKSYGIFSNFTDSLANIFCVNKNANSWELYNFNTLVNQQNISNSTPTTKNKITLGCDLASLSNRFDGYFFKYKREKYYYKLSREQICS